MEARVGAYDLTVKLLKHIGFSGPPQTILGVRCIIGILSTNLLWTLLSQFTTCWSCFDFSGRFFKGECVLVVIAFVYAVPLMNIRACRGLPELYIMTKFFLVCCSIKLLFMFHLLRREHLLFRLVDRQWKMVPLILVALAELVSLAADMLQLGLTAWELYMGNRLRRMREQHDLEVQLQQRSASEKLCKESKPRQPDSPGDV